MSATQTSRSARTGLALALALDLIVILVFAAIGRRSHEEGDAITGVLRTAWPFLIGGALGHLINLAALRRAATSIPAGVVIWVSTVVGGMVVRQLADKGTAFSFIIVTTVFTGVFLLGWRAIVAWRGARQG